jgi:hypothetical protein
MVKDPHVQAVQDPGELLGGLAVAAGAGAGSIYTVLAARAADAESSMPRTAVSSLRVR